MKTRRYYARRTFVGRLREFRVHSADSYALLFTLIIVDYIAVSTVLDNAWGRFCVVVLFGVTLLVALAASRAHLIWDVLALVFVAASALSDVVGALAPGALPVSLGATITGGVLLIMTPAFILRRIARHHIITAETVFGAACVYLLLGFSFAFIYSTVAVISGQPFFQGHPDASINDYLFFSYSTLTTVGYGNLVPAGNFGQALAMLEALSGQIYLVVIVARLVSLWGHMRPETEWRHQPRRPAKDERVPAMTRTHRDDASADS